MPPAGRSAPPPAWRTCALHGLGHTRARQAPPPCGRARAQPASRRAADARRTRCQPHAHAAGSDGDPGAPAPAPPAAAAAAAAAAPNPGAEPPRLDRDARALRLALKQLRHSLTSPARLSRILKSNPLSTAVLVFSVMSLKIPALSLLLKTNKLLLIPKLAIYGSIRGLFRKPIRTIEAFAARRTAAALQKIRRQWRNAAVIPVAAAAVGWVTNWLAVQMIFYPISFVGLPPFHQPALGAVCGEEVLSPLGYFGWQGIVPAKAAKMAGAMTEMVTTQLIDVRDVFARLDPHAVASSLLDTAPAHAADFARDLVDNSAWTRGVPLASFAAAHALGNAHRLPAAALALLADVHRDYIVGLVELLKCGVDRVLDLNTMVVSAMCADKTVLVSLFQKCAATELAFLVDSGLWFGFLLGVLQMLVWGFTDAPWTLPVGGAVVGYLTNWIALKCIFEPVHPVRVGPWELQGMFLKRQNEVSETFADHMAEHVLTSEQFFKRLLPGLGPGQGGDAPAFAALANAHTDSFAVDLARRVGLGLDDGASMAAQRAATVAAPTAADALASTAAAASIPTADAAAYTADVADTLVRTLPPHLPPGLHAYVDATLGLRDEMAAKLKAMAPERFERVLHPIFEEDELTLIVAGGVLGLLVGLAQMVWEIRGTRRREADERAAASSSPPPPPSAPPSPAASPPSSV